MDDFGPRHLNVLARRARDFSSGVNRLANFERVSGELAAIPSALLSSIHAENQPF